MIKNTSLLITLTIVLSFVDTIPVATIKFSLDDPAFDNFVSEANDYRSIVFQILNNKSPLHPLDEFYQKLVKGGTTGNTGKAAKTLINEISFKMKVMQDDVERLSAQYVEICMELGKKSDVVEAIGAEIIENANSSEDIDLLKADVQQKVKALVDFLENSKKKVENFDFERQKKNMPKPDIILEITAELNPELENSTKPLYDYEDISQKPADVNLHITDVQGLRLLRNRFTKPIAKNSELEQIAEAHGEQHVPKDELQEIETLLQNMSTNLAAKSKIAREYSVLMSGEESNVNAAFSSFHKTVASQIFPTAKQIELVKSDFNHKILKFIADNKDNEIAKDVRIKTKVMLDTLAKELKHISSRKIDSLEKINMIPSALVRAFMATRAKPKTNAVADHDAGINNDAGVANQINQDAEEVGEFHDIEQVQDFDEIDRVDTQVFEDEDENEGQDEDEDEDEDEEITEIQVIEEGDIVNEAGEIDQADEITEIVEDHTILTNEKPYEASVSKIYISGFEITIKDELTDVEKSYSVDGCDCEVTTNYSLALFESANLSGMRIVPTLDFDAGVLLKSMNMGVHGPFTKWKIDLSTKNVVKQVKLLTDVPEDFARKSENGKKYKGAECLISFYGGDKFHINFDIVEKVDGTRLLLI